MKVCLINPTNQTMYFGAPPLNLMVLAAYIKQWHEVVIIDTSANRLGISKLKEINPDIVGITGTTPSIVQAYACADYARENGYKVVMGGAHVSVMPDEALKHADAVVIGEGEIALKKIIDENLTGIVKGEPLENLDDIPMLPYDLFNIEFYVTRKEIKYLRHTPQEKRFISILTSRGCPYNCTFCHNSYRDIKYRFNSAERVVNEIEYLIENYKIEALFFIEDNFFVNKERVQELCKLMIKRGIKLPWGANSRVDNLDRETLILAKKAGCTQVTFGWESGSQKMLGIYNKGTTVEQNRESIRLCNELGLLADGTFMIGGPGETLDDMKETMKFIVENGINGLGVCVTTAFPGTQLWKNLEKEGKIMESYLNWNEFDFTSTPIRMFDEKIDNNTFMKIIRLFRQTCEYKFAETEIKLGLESLK